jgi:hypothetical protein
MLNETLRPVRGLDAEIAGVDVSRAAVLLGISHEAVRKRIRRGSLRAYKRDGVWYVVLPAARDGGTSHSQDAARDAVPDSVPDGGQDALIEQLRGEVAFLRSLTEHQAGVIAELSRRVPQLPAAGVDTVATAPESASRWPAAAEPAQTPPRPRWQFWRR